MTKVACMVTVLALALILGGAAPPPPRTVAESGRLTLDVVLEGVDLAGNTLTARPYCQVVPPSGTTGGMVYTGHQPPGVKATKYERLPVMPEAGLQGKGLRPGMWVTLRLGVLEGGALVVLAVEENRGCQRVGINSIDAPKKPGAR